MSDALQPEPAAQEPLEQAIEKEALSVELRAAVMACLSGTESRRWTISELVERFKNPGGLNSPSLSLAAPDRWRHQRRLFREN